MRQHNRRVFNICYRFTGNRTEAEDLTQDVFLRIYKTLASYRAAHGGFATWMTSVTRNLLIDHYRRTKRDRATDSLDDAMTVVENKESTARRPDEQALLGELSGQVQSALTKLSPELLAPSRFSFICDCTVQECWSASCRVGLARLDGDRVLRRLFLDLREGFRRFAPGEIWPKLFFCP